ncbi:hypothetical protein LN996_04695 [Arthrobacter sp. AK01]|uniref:hypothetical protein n=1 Tax=Arthrobacter sp. AK01 TaxID=2894084 RepID=UPI001E4363B5|nr:hypothetical protein [Arthrobacter sp. AK01]MCD4850099.1 hypothetical protein [Arthrobacter sp. AK01]
MAFNLDYTITYSGDTAAKYGVNAKQNPARASIFGEDLEIVKKEAEATLATVGSTRGQLYRTPGTDTTFASGVLVSTYVAGEGWTDEA